MRSARGGIVLGWFLKIIALLAILAMVSFETGAIIVAKVTADRVAIDAASEGGQVLAETHDRSKAEGAARALAAKEQVTVSSFRVIDGGQFVQVTIQKKASTFIVQHIGFLRRFATAEATHMGAVQ